MQYLLDTLDISSFQDSAGSYELHVQATVPPLGYTTVLLTPTNAQNSAKKDAFKTILPASGHSPQDSSAICQAAGFTASHPLRNRHTTAEAAAVDDRTGKLRADDGFLRAPYLENEHLKVLFDGLTGRVAAVLHKESGQLVDVRVALVYWLSRCMEQPHGGAGVMQPDTQVRMRHYGPL